MKNVPLTKNYFAKVDDSDYLEVSKYKWHIYTNLKGSVRAQRVIVDSKTGKRIVIKMHNFIMNPPTGKIIDHINGDALDNRRENLRICTQSENCYNRSGRRRSTSKYKGVSTIGTKFRARCNSKHIGYFKTEEEAARAYDDYAKSLQGSFARLNFNKE